MIKLKISKDIISITAEECLAGECGEVKKVVTEKVYQDRAGMFLGHR